MGLESGQKENIHPETLQLGIWVGKGGVASLCGLLIRAQSSASHVPFSDPGLLRSALQEIGMEEPSSWGCSLPTKVPGQWWVP